MCVKILSCSGTVYHQISVFPIHEEEFWPRAFHKKITVFTTALTLHAGYHDSRDNDGFDVSPDVQDEDPASIHINTPQYDFYDTEAEMPEADDMDYDTFDRYFSSYVVIPSEEALKKGKVKRHKVDDNGVPVGHSYDNLVLNTILYEVGFEDNPSSIPTSHC